MGARLRGLRRSAGVSYLRASVAILRSSESPRCRRRRSKSSKAWMQRARQRPLREAGEGARATARAPPTSWWRSTARTGCSRPGSVVVDLGAAPGGWSQVAAREGRPAAARVRRASTCSSIEPIPGVHVHPGRFPRPRRCCASSSARWAGERSTLCCPTWPPICRASPASDRRAEHRIWRTGARFRARNT